MADQSVSGDRGNTGLPMKYRDLGDGSYVHCHLGPAYLFSNITTATTTVVKGSPGTLKAIIINSLGTVASVATIYNNTAGSGTKLGTINTLALLGPIVYDVWMSTGITVVTTGTLPPDITVIYL